MSIEAMKKVLAYTDNDDRIPSEINHILAQAIAEAEKHEVSQEPVAVERFKWIFEDKYGNRFTQAEVYYTEREAQESAKICGNKSIGKASESPIICWDMRESSPPQRQWVGLTEDERTAIRAGVQTYLDITQYEYGKAVQQATELKLQEKNT